MHVSSRSSLSWVTEDGSNALSPPSPRAGDTAAVATKAAPLKSRADVPATQLPTPRDGAPGPPERSPLFARSRLGFKPENRVACQNAGAMRPLTLIALAASLLAVSVASASSSARPELRLVAKSPLV